MDDPILIKNWGKAVSFLINNTFNILPLAFLKVDTWMRTFQGSLDDSLIQRLEGHMFALQNCTLEQARELIRIRIAAFFLEGVGSKTEWILNQLRGRLETYSSPRAILELANHALVHPGENFPPVMDVLANTYQEEYDKVAADFEIWPPDATHLLYALEPYLIYHAGFKDIQRPQDNKYISLAGQCSDEDGNDMTCAFIVNTAENNQTVWAAFRRGVAFLEENPKGICYYITDERCVFRGPDRWKKVHEELEKFKRLKGRVLFLDRTRAIDWYALTALRFKLNNGDVTLISNKGEQRTAVAEDLALYLKEGFTKNLLELNLDGSKNSNGGSNIETEFEKKTSRDSSQGTLYPKDLEAHIREILEGSPMHLMQVKLLLGYLSKNKVSITHDLLLEFLRERNDVFTLFLSGNSIVQLL
jgi:hypothetical protein